MLNKLQMMVSVEIHRRKYKVGEPISNEEIRELKGKHFMNGFDGLDIFELLVKNRKLTKAQDKYMKKLIKEQKAWEELMYNMNDI
jgi:hypothetical protein